MLIGCDGIRSRIREIIDPYAAPVRYVPVLNIGGYIPEFPLDTPSDEFQMMFGTRCFFGWTAAPDGSAGWFANPPHPREPAPGELEAMTDADWRTWLLELLGDRPGADARADRRCAGAVDRLGDLRHAAGPALAPGQHDHHRRRRARDLACRGAGRGDGAGGRGGAGAVPARRAGRGRGVQDVRRPPPGPGGAGGEGRARGRATPRRRVRWAGSSATPSCRSSSGGRRRASARRLTWMHGHHIEWER